MGYQASEETIVENYEQWISYGKYEFYGAWAKDSFCATVAKCI